MESTQAGSTAGMVPFKLASEKDKQSNTCSEVLLVRKQSAVSSACGFWLCLKRF